MFHGSFKSWLEWSELISANKGCLSFGSVCWFDHCGCLRNMDLNYEGNEVKNEKNNGNWRAEIDRSAPFESVKEAVSRFGGVGYWKPTLRLNYKISSAENCQTGPLQLHCCYR